ncbi:MAG: bifunctional folylpolyglutamate synthase/dihydrofolate synthase [Treponema sp.]|nr:bifunctional folylpolyglutamate synthase/dihydrofolate synthase [Treponema sp.]
MSQIASVQKFESWVDSYLNFEKTPKKNIFWLDTMRFFCEKFNFPEKAAPCFHVAGSKGKGSVSMFIASILEEAGFKTGLYTSPHILDFIERISRTNGPFEDEAYDKAVAEIMAGVKAIKKEELPGERPVTWFELVTLFSFLVFRQAKVDYSVFEVGLGGSLDSTNVVSPICSVITPIEKEHTEFLGDTLEKIAFEKGGIIKENTPVVISKQNPSVRRVFEKIAEEKKARAIFLEDYIQDLKCDFYTDENCPKENQAEKQFRISFSSKIFSRPIKAHLKMFGSFQAENAALASLAVKTAIPEISEEIIEKGLSKAKLPARFEIIKNLKGCKNIPFLILDGAHTVNSVRFTLETLDAVFSRKDCRAAPCNVKNFTLLFACAADKDAKDIAPLFKNYFDKIFLTKPGNVKQADLALLQKAFDEAGLSYDLNEDFEMQIKKSLEYADKNHSILLVTGSFYLIAVVKSLLNKIGGSL